MTWSTLDLLRRMLQKRDRNTGEWDDRDDAALERIQGEVHQGMLAKMLQCRPDAIPEPFRVLDPVIPATSHGFDRAMATGRRRLLVVARDGTYSGTPQLTITAVSGGIETSEVVEIAAATEYLSREVWDDVLPSPPYAVACNADLIAAGGSVALFEHVGELTDIEARWTAGLFLMERSDRYRKDSEPSKQHPWITDAMAAFRAYLDRYCLEDTPGRIPTRRMGRSYGGPY